jgi:hypothetical protein
MKFAGNPNWTGKDLFCVYPLVDGVRLLHILYMYIRYI